MRNIILIVGGLVGAVSPLALATPITLQIDINALSAQASGPLSEDFSGTIQLFNTPQQPDPNALIVDLLVDGVRQNTPGADSDQFSFILDLEFDTGSIISGRLLLLVDSNGSENSYIASAVVMQGGSIIDAGGNFSIGGTTVGGVFDDALGTVLGVDISPWGLAAPAVGQFTVIGLDPDGQGFDPNADVDVFVLTPAPAGLSTLAIGLLLASRRRR